MMKRSQDRPIADSVTGRRSRAGRDKSPFFGHDGDMGEAGNKPRKPRRRLDKVPEFEEPNTLSLPGLTGATQFGVRDGRFGHGSDGKHPGMPGRAGLLLLRLLGRRPKE